MKNYKSKKLTVSVGIPTYLAGEHLVSVINSIFQKSNIDLIDQVLIAVDGSKISKAIVRKIKRSKLKVITFKSRAGQSQRMNDIMRAAKTDILILTNDDVIFDKYAIKNIVSLYKSKRGDLISARVYPLKSRSFLERILKVSEEIKDSVVRNFPNNDTYLNTNGRFLALSKSLYKKLHLPKHLVNSDAYIYFFSKMNKYQVTYTNKIICNFREPSSLREYANQVQKFQMSQEENSKYFSNQMLSDGYKIPVFNILKSNITIFFKSPALVVMYYLLFGYVRVINLLNPVNYIYPEQGIWQTDYSTKQL